MNRAALMLLGLLACLLQPATVGRAEDTIRLGFFAERREWSRAEVRATFNQWTQELADKFHVPVSVSHYDDVQALRRDFLSGRIDGINTDAMTIVRNFHLEELAEGYATVMSGGWNLMLFSRADGDVVDPGEMLGKRAVLLENDETSRVWLEILCMRHYDRACKDVLADIQRVSTNNQALLRVFFGKADVALVYGYGHALAVDLNPSLDRTLRRIAELPLSSLYYAFYRAGVDKAFRKRSLEVIPKVHTYPRGRQLLDLFKMDRLELASPQQLLPYYRLDAEYRALRARTGRGKADG